jgi:hypothetical protein
MGQQWIEILNEGNVAFEEGQYRIASAYYAQVLAEVKKGLKQLNSVVSQDSISVVNEFCSCTRLAAMATLENGQPAQAEALYLEAKELLALFISNLNNRFLYRALVLTEFKNMCYDLFGLYKAIRQIDRLNEFTKAHHPMLIRWFKEMKMVDQSGMEMN